MSRVEPLTITSKSGRPILLRTMEPDDAAAFMEHLNDFVATAQEFGVTLPHERTATVEKQRVWLQERIDKPTCVAIGAFDEAAGNVLAGAIHFDGHPLQRMAHHGTIGISVTSTYRDDGIGIALVHRVIDWARAHPTIECVTLGVFAHNARAVHVYQKLGFKEHGRMPRFIKYGPGAYADDIQMSLWVK